MKVIEFDNGWNTIETVQPGSSPVMTWVEVIIWIDNKNVWRQKMKWLEFSRKRLWGAIDVSLLKYICGSIVSLLLNLVEKWHKEH